ncbi:MAG TPA: AAA family ATPase [Bryobacteraceae bacterium]|nr:AAA family ATPase [Bryobacteraceae bacterium]
MIGIELLGGFRITRDGHALAEPFSARLQSLVAYLTLHAGTAVSRQQLAFLFWADSREAQARTNLRQLLHHLRTAVPDIDRYLDSDAQTLGWRNDGDWMLDAAEFARSAAEAKDLNAASRAAHLYKGDLLPGIYDDWIDPHRARLSSAYDELLERLCNLAVDSGDFPGAIAHAETRLSRDPLRESGYQTLMRLHARREDRASAVAVFQRCADVLKRELGIEPGHATKRLRDQIMDARLPDVPAPVAPVSVPDTPLVGRANELRHLDALWDGSGQDQAVMLVLTGEPGVGKTRLVRELQGHALLSGGTVAWASCYSSSQALAYSAAGDWLRNPAIRTNIQKLTAPERAYLARIVPELASDQALSEPPSASTESWQRRLLFDAMSKAVLGPGRAILLVIDDLQWCDSETLEWLQYLLRQESAARVRVAATARMDEIPPDHAIANAMRDLVRRGQAAEMEIAPLDEHETVALAEGVAGSGLDPELAERLYSGTRGNPLFILETVRARGNLAPKVHAVIAGRLALLDEHSRELASVAATIGRPFSIELAARIVEVDEDVAVRAIDNLWRNRILRLEGEDRYDFVHGCSREAAYSQIGPARRRQLHRRTAEALEVLAGDESAAHIATQYEHAGLPLRAIPWYQRAAAVVRRRFAEGEAIGSLTRALALLEKQPPSAERDRLELDLLASLGPSLSATEGFASEAAGKVYGRARILCELIGESTGQARVLGGSWSFHIVRAEIEIAREIAERYRALGERTGDPALWSAGVFTVGSTSYFRGALTDSRSQLERSNELAAQCSERFFALGPEVGVFSRSHLAHVQWLLGDSAGALDESNRDLERAEHLSHPFSHALALAYAAMLHQFRDDPGAARDRAEAAASLCRRYGFRYYLSWTPIIIGWARARSGDIAAGLDEMRNGFDALRATGAAIRAPFYLGLIAQVCGWNRQPDAGLNNLRAALEIGERTGEAWPHPELQRIRGDLLLQTGDRSEAETSYRNAVRLARRMSAKAWQEKAENSLANLRS